VADYDKAPLTGAVSLHDVIRHLIHFGPARNELEVKELLGAVDRDDPDAPEPEDAPLSDAEKAAAYDRHLKDQVAAQPAWPVPEPVHDDTTGGHG
jgi:hypothetical protein